MESPKLALPQSNMQLQRLPNEILTMIIEYVLEIREDAAMEFNQYYYLFEPNVVKIARVSRLFLVLSMRHLVRFLKIVERTWKSEAEEQYKQDKLGKKRRLAYEDWEDDGRYRGYSDGCLELDCVQAMLRSLLSSFGMILGVGNDLEYWDGVLGLNNYCVPEVGLAELSGESNPSDGQSASG